jgi:hypothetical protein
VNLIQEVAWNNTPQIKKEIIRNNYPLEIWKLIEQKKKSQKNQAKNQNY